MYDRHRDMKACMHDTRDMYKYVVEIDTHMCMYVPIWREAEMHACVVRAVVAVCGSVW